jgi:hypothetical protein
VPVENPSAGVFPVERPYSPGVLRRGVTIGLCGASVVLLGWAFLIMVSHSSMTGEVTSLEPGLCVARHAAMGDCFVPQPGLDVSALRVGECIRVRFVSGNGEGPSRLYSFSEVDPEDADDGDCGP